jgi:hypothetical protein
MFPQFSVVETVHAPSLHAPIVDKSHKGLNLPHGKRNGVIVDGG